MYVCEIKKKKKVEINEKLELKIIEILKSKFLP